MQRYMERCARVAASAGPSSARHWFASKVPETWQARINILRALGYAPVRYYFEMQRPLDDDLPEAVLPLGLALLPPSARTLSRDMGGG